MALIRAAVMWLEARLLYLSAASLSEQLDGVQSIWLLNLNSLRDYLPRADKHTAAARKLYSEPKQDYLQKLKGIMEDQSLDIHDTIKQTFLHTLTHIYTQCTSPHNPATWAWNWGVLTRSPLTYPSEPAIHTLLTAVPVYDHQFRAKAASVPDPSAFCALVETLPARPEISLYNCWRNEPWHMPVPNPHSHLLRHLFCIPEGLLLGIRAQDKPASASVGDCEDLQLRAAILGLYTTRDRFVYFLDQKPQRWAGAARAQEKVWAMLAWAAFIVGQEPEERDRRTDSLGRPIGDEDEEDYLWEYHDDDDDDDDDDDSNDNNEGECEDYEDQEDGMEYEENAVHGPREPVDLDEKTARWTSWIWTRLVRLAE
ncbi:hypothetical protein CC78DRAFT_605825 [Lojkania enalia]|uniref:Uncharacterized protein n=1 Tax=Lojkania enalia TaxID=147567 RepID=A0A9P4N2M9_9PLEO|nr:hypothetical protein CC78DRAFT_605825 [Didymosphaeria enalia]